MNKFKFIVDDNYITNEEELHQFILEKINLCTSEIVIDESYRGKKKKKLDYKPHSPKPVCLKLMFPYKIEVMCGCKQMIFGILVDEHGHHLKNPLIEFELSDYSIGNISFSPAISFGDGCFCTTFIGERVGCGFLKMHCKGTDLERVIPVEVIPNCGC